jgi:hypothetical protein
MKMAKFGRHAMFWFWSMSRRKSKKTLRAKKERVKLKGEDLKIQTLRIENPENNSCNRK